MTLRGIENFISNKFVLSTCETMKNKKGGDKNQECQRLMTELYVKMINLKAKTEELRNKAIKHKMRITKYMNSMHKMERIIKDCDKGKLEYL
jgi:hypothetical protein